MIPIDDKTHEWKHDKDFLKEVVVSFIATFDTESLLTEIRWILEKEFVQDEHTKLCCREIGNAAGNILGDVIGDSL